MESQDEFKTIEVALNLLKRKDLNNEKVDELIEIMLKQNEVSKDIYEFATSTQNANLELFNVIKGTVEDLVRSTEDQNKWNELCLQGINQLTENIEVINKSSKSISESIDTSQYHSEESD